VTELFLPIGATILAAAVMGVCAWHSVRAVRGGRGCAAATEPEELLQAREELAHLRRQAEQGSGTGRSVGVPSAGPLTTGPRT
jgi:hypothetical protein